MAGLVEPCWLIVKIEIVEYIQLLAVIVFPLNDIPQSIAQFRSESASYDWVRLQDPTESHM